MPAEHERDETDSSEARDGRQGGGLWPAIAWAETLLAVGLAGAGLAVASAFESCDFLGGCPPTESSSGAASVVWLVFAAAVTGTGFFMASWTSGWRGPRAVAQGAAALVAGAAAGWLGGEVSVAIVDEFLPALVLGVGVAGTIAIRPTVPRAIGARLVALAILAVLAVGTADSGGVVIGLALLTLPALGVVERALGSRAA